MEPLYEVIATHRDALAVCYVKDYADLKAQASSLLGGLPTNFAFQFKARDRDIIVDSQAKFLLLNPSQASILAVVEETDSRPTVPRVRLANLAFLKRHKAAIAPKPLSQSQESVPEDERCPICMDRLRRPMKAKCGHVCCLPCWEKALERYLECPLCRGRVRLKTLRPA